MPTNILIWELFEMKFLHILSLIYFMQNLDLKMKKKIC